jgi:VanZ family protein
VPALVYGGILFLSSIPGDRFPDTGLPDWISYVAHAVEYAVLGVSLRWALHGTSRATAVTIALGAGLACIDEVFQSTVPDRDPSILDLLVDVAALAFACLMVARRLTRRRPGAGGSRR